MEGTVLADRFQEKVAGVCLIAGTLLMAAGTFLEFSAGMLFGAGLVGLLAYLCFIPGLLGIARLLRQGAPRLSVFVGLLATVGCVGAVNFQTAILHEWAARTAGTPEATMAAIAEVVEGRLFPVLLLFSINFPLALLILGVGLARAGGVPIWAAALLGGGALIYPVGHIGSIQLLMHLADLLLAIPLIWLGLRSLTSATPRGVAVPATT